LPILFCLKCDGTIDYAPWVAIWTPFWLVDFIALILAFLLCLDAQEMTNEEGDLIPNEKVPLLTKVLNMVTTVLFVLFQIFLFMQLDKYLRWNWFAVFSPWLAYEFIQILMVLPIALGSIPLINFDNLSVDADQDEESGENDVLMKRIVLENEYFEKRFNRATERKEMVGFLLRAWLAIFVAVKLNGTVDWNWGLVFLPIWVYFLVQYVFAYYFRLWGIVVLKSANIQDYENEAELDPLRAAKV
jgi:hypothetical protein